MPATATSAPVRALRVLVVSNMWPTEASPGFGTFVQAQVRSLQQAADSLDVQRVSFDARGRPWRYLTAAMAIRTALRTHRPDVVHVHYGLTFLPVWFARPRCPVVLTVHGTDVDHARFGRLTAWAVRRADSVIAVSVALAARLADRAGIDPDSIAAIPCGVDLDSRRPLDRAAARATLGLSASERPVLLFPAHPERPEKRYDRAKAVADAAGATLLDYGRTLDESTLVAMLNAACCALVTSDREGFGLGMIDALACGTPVLAVPVGGAPTVLDSLEGCHVGEFDAAQWALLAKQSCALSDSENLRRRLRERAAEYSLQQIASRIADEYALVLNASVRRATQEAPKADVY